MLEIGKTYRLPLRSGLDVDIVGSGSNENQGQFFVGVTRNDTTGDWTGIYRPDGTRIWSGHHVDDTSLFNLILPERFVNLNDALSLIRNRLRGPSLSTIEHDLLAMPFRELER
jgi:hypothetical protein